MNLLLQRPEAGYANARSALQNTIIDEARAWVGMRFLHQGRSDAPDTAQAIDCLGLLVGIARRCGLHGKTGEKLHLQDATQYGLQPDGERLSACLRAQLIEVGADSMRAGDILLFRLAGNPQHLGIATTLADGRAGLLHAYAPVGRVVEHGFQGPWPQRLCGVFRLPLATNFHVISTQD